MLFDFNQDQNRQKTESDKWNKYPNDVLPMWVADSDYSVCPSIIDALKKRLNDSPTLGYGQISDKLKALICHYLKSQFNWVIDPNWICFTPGVVGSLNMARMITGQDDDEVITAIPVYPHLHRQTPIIKRKMRYISMLENNDGYEFNLDEYDKAINNKTALLLLCNPHNPLGKVYSKDMLEAIAKRAINHDFIICSDEIHADFILDNNKKHIPIASLSSEIAQRTITLMAASKTFNIAGLNCSFAIIANDQLRERFETSFKGLVGGVNILGLLATQSAYETGHNWQAEQIKHLQKQASTCYQRINQIEGLSMKPLEATYLAWIDCRSILDKIKAKGYASPYAYFLAHKLALSDGQDFRGNGFVRMNLACSQANLNKGLDIIEAAVKALS